MLELILSAAAWLIIGVAVAAYIYLDAKRAKEKRMLWVVIGFLFSILGLVLYYFLVKRKRAGYQYPPKPEYGAPDYKFEKAGKQPEAKVDEAPVAKPAAASNDQKPTKPGPQAAGEAGVKETPSTAAEKVAEGKMHVETEGTPRCPKCNAAISIHDFNCPRCGEKLRD